MVLTADDLRDLMFLKQLRVMTYFLLLLCTGHEETRVGVHPKCLQNYFESL